MKNIILIFGDQHRACDVGCYGNRQVITPNLDSMAKSGVMFTNAVSNCPVCTPARGSLLTGMQPLKHRAFANDLPIDPDLSSIATVFKLNGYKTGYIGKWHLDGAPRDRFTPPDRRLGFEYWAAYNCHHDYFDTKYYTDSDTLIKKEGYEPEIQTGLAIDFIDKNTKNPFLLVLSYGTPHDPYDKVPKKYKDLYDPKDINVRGNFRCSDPAEAGDSQDDGHIEIGKKLEDISNYLAHITALDECIGKIRDHIKELGIEKDTIIIYTSDHGDMLYSHGREKKQTWYSESLDVPLIFEGKGLLPEGYKNTGTVFSLVDLAPTLYGLLDIKAPVGIDGRDLSNDLARKEITQKNVYIMNIMSVDVGPLDPVYLCGGWRGVKNSRYTYIKTLKGDRYLFDNTKDPLQIDNLAGSSDHVDINKRLEKKLTLFMKNSGDEYLPWKERIKKEGVVELWNQRTLDLNGMIPEEARKEHLKRWIIEE